eukprot:CAMPEP_0117450018 /NCGR_PEP_ID=MMETSP0759-20121206/8248_1 /TAXON_ID=63605 /ORGANISM="Percolomonas cosmopolitus, Strain WS" /LENGTH=231 /DNA_ID=CAMNT_0005242519 /DNA_START=59 /DNA_END=750 /DNA_ORIENTATION=-
MGKRKAQTKQNKPRLTKKQYQDIQVKQLAKKVSDHQKLVKEKAVKEMEERKTKSLSKKELQTLKKEKKEALRQFTLKKAQLQFQRNKQAKEEWKRIQESLKDEVFSAENAEEKRNKEALQKMESFGWKVRSNFEADSDLVGSALTERQQNLKRLKKVADVKLQYLKGEASEEHADEGELLEEDGEMDYIDEEDDDGLEDALMAESDDEQETKGKVSLNEDDDSSDSSSDSG